MGALISLLFGHATPAPTDTPTAAPYTPLPTLAATTAPFLTTAAPTLAPTLAPTPTAAPAAPWAPANPAWSQLNLSGWGRCLGWDLKTYNCDRVPGSMWAADASGLIVNQGTRQCLQASAAAPGAPLTPATCQPGNALQQWTRAGGRIRLASNTGLVAEVPGYDYTRPLALWNDNGGANQAWSNT